MVDTVWMRLTLSSDDSEMHFMFGPTGIMSFNLSDKNDTVLHRADGEFFFVKEDPDHIFSLIHSIRHPVVNKLKKKAIRKRVK